MVDTNDNLSELSPIKRALLALKELQAKLDAMERRRTEPIAIIGMGCRFPGEIVDADSFWRLLREGRDAITEVPRERWDIEAFYDPDPAKIGKMVTRWGGFVSGVSEFDASFFSISPREAMSMDPQQRLLLEVAWEALEDGGQAVEKLAGSKSGVFVGVGTNDYTRLIERSALGENDVYCITGNHVSAAVGRISYALGLQGPALAVDTACSSSLTAVHLACQSLRQGECSLALAGGVNLTLTPEATIKASQAQMMARDGRCKTFDARADGYVRGEGCGVVVLKRLSEAVAAGDPIRAVIRGSAVNHDGRSSGLTVPNGPAQQELIREALKSGGVGPDEVSYIETHGTGTPLGDPIEVGALAGVFGGREKREQALVIGAVKSNIGHLEAAAGVAGLMKVVLSLEQRQIPANLHLQQLNPHISLEQTPFVIPTKLQPWISKNGPLCAGVSSFGFGGTNAHLVVEEAPAAREIEASAEANKTYLLPLSARSAGALREMAARYVEYLDNEETPLQDICYTAGARRSHHQHRLCVVGSDREKLRRELKAYADDEEALGVYSGRKSVGPRLKVAFVFGGQGTQWVGTGRELLRREAVLQRKLEECEAALRPYLDWSVMELLRSEGELSEQERRRLRETRVIQPLLFALQVGLAELWRSWGVEPDAVVGHSMGEVAAACVSGALSLSEAARVICLRGEAMAAGHGHGGMAAVEQSLSEVEQLSWVREGALLVAAENGPHSCTLSGEVTALKELAQWGEQRGVRVRQLEVDYAFHSEEMGEYGARLREQLGAVKSERGAVRIYSTVRGAEVSGEELSGEYWEQNVGRRVEFRAALARMRADGIKRYVEVGVDRVLGRAVAESTATRVGKEEVVVVGTLRKGIAERAAVLESVGQLYVSGVDINWERVNGVGRCVKLPSYPWQRQRYWVDGVSGSYKLGATRYSTQPAHPLLGHRLYSALPQIVFETVFSASTPPYLDDHRIEGTFGSPIVVPGSSHVSMALSAAKEVFDTDACRLEGISFSQALILLEGESRIVQFILTPVDTDEMSFQIFSAAEDDQHRESWTLHASGNIKREEETPTSVAEREDEPEESYEQLSSDQFYENLWALGYHLGRGFQWLDTVQRGAAQAVCEMRLAEVSDQVDNYQLHAGIIDSCFQLMGLSLPHEEIADWIANEAIYVPLTIERVRFHRSAVGRLRAVATLRPDDREAGARREELLGDIRLFDQTGMVAEIEGLYVKRVDRKALMQVDQGGQNWMYELVWRVAPLADKTTGSTTNRWLIFADKSGVAEAICSQLDSDLERPVLVYAGEKYEQKSATVYEVDPLAAEDLARVLQTVGAADLRIVHLWSLDVQSAACSSAAELLAWQQRSCGSVLHLVQALGRSESAAEQRLWVVTSGAQALGETGEIEAAQAAVWGLGRVVGHEQPQQWGGLIDLDGSSSAAESAAQLVKELRGQGDAGAENEVGYRGGERYVPRLVRARTAEPEAATLLQISGAGSYLITGGMGGLGLEVGKWLVSQGARHVVLLGRSGPKESATEAIETMQAAGAMVECVQADVADTSRMREVIEEIEQAGKELRGVIHAAGVLDDGVLSGQTWERFEGVMNSKVLGAWNLAELTREKELDFFVLFSSGASILGSPGQGNYAAANAYLDSLAAARQRRGEVGLTINWGPWAEVGLAAREDRARLVASRGMQSMKPADALMALGQALDQRRQGQIALMTVDWDQLLALVPSIDKVPLLKEIATRRRSPAKRLAQWSTFKRQLEAAAPGERYGLLQSYLQREVEKVLKFTAAGTLDPQVGFTELGVDSLTAVEIKNALEAAVGRPLPVTLLFDHPTVEAITRRIAQEIDFIDLPEEIAERSRHDYALDKTLSEIERLSEEDMDQIFLSIADEHYKELEES